MADVQCENGYTKIANELLEAFVKYEFPPKTNVPQRLFLFVIRKTYGYHKKEDVISISQFQEGIKEKNRTNTVYWLNYLVQARLLVKNKISPIKTKWRVNKDYDCWLPLVQVRLLVQVRSWSSASTDTRSSASTDTHKRKKEIIQKKDYHEKTILICKDLGIQPSSKVDEYVRKYADKEIKPLVDSLIQWCEEKKIKPSGLRLMNWMRREFK